MACQAPGSDMGSSSMVCVRRLLVGSHFDSSGEARALLSKGECVPENLGEEGLVRVRERRGRTRNDKASPIPAVRIRDIRRVEVWQCESEDTRRVI